MKNNHFKIQLSRKSLTKQYSVYIVIIKKDQYKYFYIGQTGNSNYKIARSAFLRLAGHLQDKGYATDNQIYQQIVRKILKIDKIMEKKAFPDNVKNQVMLFLENSDIEMFVFPIAKFSNSITKEEHKENLDKTIQVEKQLIKYYSDKYKDKILNKKIPKSNKNEINNIAKQIINIIENE